MSEGLRFALTLIAALGSGLVGGVFFAFSGFVMPALRRLRPDQGMAAMQAINVTAVRPPLMLAMFGTALACVALIVTSLGRWREPAALLRVAGGGLYLVGTVLVTMLGNVPRNNALAAADADSPAGAETWTRVVPGWTAWNTVRTVAAVAAAAALTLSLVAEQAGPGGGAPGGP